MARIYVGTYVAAIHMNKDTVPKSVLSTLKLC